MNEIVTAARSAREKLSAALAALQSPDAGNLIDTVAEPVAAAMSALHAIESTGGGALAERGPAALAGVRRALELLQTAAPSAVVDNATAQVAGSLGLVHQVAQAGAASPAAAQPAAAQPAVAQPAVAQPAVAQPAQTAEQAAALQAALAQTALAGTPFQTPSEPPPAAPAPVAATPAAPPQAAPAQAAAPAAPAPAAEAGPRAPAGATVIEAAFGAHSPTNFYKGLSGNDVIDDGGVFVATYRIPRIGQEIWLRVSMPGGYEFDARAEVKWTRESGSADSPPGFGAQFREISQEGRQLVYRYVRNREPLFHDDF